MIIFEQIIALPLIDPVLKFLVILLIILFIPILFEKIRMPNLLGMIVAGIIIGPFGFNILERDSGIILSGTAGLLYIMFLAGLEIDMHDFRKNAFKSIFLGLFGFIIPMILGIICGIYFLHFSVITSVLLASMFASHTLITYPIINKLGITKNRAVTISVGSTLITNMLALIVLAIIVGMSAGEIDSRFWIRMTLLFVAFTLAVALLFPILARWFFKRYSDSVSQYVFVLALLFLGAALSQLAGIESIIGAFLAGFALNGLIPRTSPLKNRIDFVGNAIFIPFFLLGVGMLINFRAFTDPDTLLVAGIMSVTATAGKFVTALLTQKIFNMSKDERYVIFGLTNSQAAATLAAVIIGYNIILGYNVGGEPIRLLNDSVLNGTIIMILFTCTIASFATSRGAQNIALSELSDDQSTGEIERILIPVSNPNNIDELINLTSVFKSPKNKDGLYALSIIQSDTNEPDARAKSKKLLEYVRIAASSNDMDMNTLLRYDGSIVNGITNIIRENNITDLLLGLHEKSQEAESILGKITEGILENSHVNTYIYRLRQPISTIKRHIVIIPENAEYESGFSFWLSKIWNISHNTGAKMVFYSTEKTTQLLMDIYRKHPIDSIFNLINSWDELIPIAKELKNDDSLIIILSRKDQISYHKAMGSLPYLVSYIVDKYNLLLVFPAQSIYNQDAKIDLTNSSLIEVIERVDLIGKTIAQLFKKGKSHPTS
jgi:Kef-type K+ transport system membrane component KefB/nucleotide-binding universal stress UspA family protein